MTRAPSQVPAAAAYLTKFQWDKALARSGGLIIGNKGPNQPPEANCASALPPGTASIGANALVVEIWPVEPRFGPAPRTQAVA
jgi:hypothetical protein